MVYRSVTGYVKREGRLTYRRTSRQNDEVGRLPTVSNLIQRCKSRRHSAEAFVILHSVQTFKSLRYDRTDILNVLFITTLGSAVNVGKSLVHQVVHLYVLRIGVIQNPVRGRNQVSLDGFLL